VTQEKDINESDLTHVTDADKATVEALEKVAAQAEIEMGK